MSAMEDYNLPPTEPSHSCKHNFHNDFRLRESRSSVVPVPGLLLQLLHTLLIC